MGVLQQPAGQLRFRREHDLAGDSGQLTSFLVGGPVLGQVQGPSDQGVPGRGRVGEGDRDLAQRDAAEGAAVLVCCSGAVGGGFRVGGLIDDQHRVILALACGQAPGCPVRGGVEHPLVIDAGAGEQVLHPVRTRVPGGLGESPAVAVVQFREQAAHHVTAGHAGLPPGEGRRDPPIRSSSRPACASWSTVASAAVVRLFCSTNWHDHGSRASFPASPAIRYQRVKPRPRP